ncbi:MAG: hypothetical protein JXD18_10205 [Anaerolineae bacterium]|nr:hypothetical protein [Anaerolineae bacterium]
MEITTQVVRGKPIAVGERVLIPVARRTSGLRRRATISTTYSAWGGGFVHVHPLGIVEKCGEQERHIAIPDVTSQAMLGILVTAIVVPLLLLLAARSARRR